ncbi:MAG TPA: hypothetical protein VM364_18460 [Vicinamibacterales bacterium]|nr:hypothetical protein [Vicinamibacterales bacterium]
MVHAARRKGRAKPRILYWFRTPPGVRVGRAPLDEEAIRQIEAANPDVEFDWTRILKGQGAQPEPPPAERRASERPRQSKRAAGTDLRPPAREDGEGRASENGAAETRERPQEAASTGADEPPVQEVPPVFEEPTTAAHARLGSEGLARLRGRYAEMLARIDERVSEPDARDRLKELAERLNPDAWVTDTDVAEGLEAYEAAFESLRTALGPRRKAAEPPAADTSG